MNETKQIPESGAVPGWRNKVREFRYDNWLTSVRWKHHFERKKKLKAHRIRFGEFMKSVAAEPKKYTSSMPLSDLKVGVILDTFSFACFEPECHLISFTPESWPEVLERNPIDFLLIESAWEGNKNTWPYRIEHFASPPDEQLDLLLEYCRVKGIPTVFWNKEDPPSFDRFIKTAAKCDYIFTTDENCVEKYEEYCGHDRVDTLPFAAQPKIHHPKTDKSHNGKVCFAGTYYADDFDRRKAGMDLLLNGAVDFELDIFDRQHGYDGEHKNKYRFPERFQPFIRGSLSYEEMLGAYKEYGAFLNVNSVDDSPTMFARRVFELLACGTPVVSTESAAITNLLGDSVLQVKTEDDVTSALKKILEDEEYRDSLSKRGLEKVSNHHTYAHRLAKICHTLGIPVTLS